MRNRSGLVIGWLSIAGFVACGGQAHSLGGDEVKQQQEGNSGTGGGNGNSNAGGATVGTGATASHAPVADGGTSQPPSPGAGGATAAAGNGGAAPTYTTGSCGSCENVVTAGMTFAGCCLDDGTCGVDSSNATSWARDTSGRRGIAGGCQPRDQVGVPDSHCTSQSAPFIALNGCCRPDGTCGVDVGILHLGCVQAVVLPESPAPADGGGPLPGPVAPETCNYAPVLPDDAGF